MPFFAAARPLPPEWSETVSTQPALSFSIVIATKNRPFELARTLHSLLAQTLRPMQVLIVDQSEKAECLAGVRPWLAHAGIELEYRHDPNLSGAAAARNRALPRARGAIWLFLDDDVCLEPTFLEELLTVYRAHPGASGVCGIVSNYAPPRRGYRVFSRLFVHGPFVDDRQPLYWRAEALRMAAPVPVTRMGGGLMSFRAEAIRGLRFDERYTGAAPGEDVAFCMQLPRSSRLLLAPRARLAHFRSPNQRERRHWLGPEAQAAWYLYLVHWREEPGAGLCFLCLNLGFGLAALAASLRRRSLAPWRDAWLGIQRARAAASD